MKSSCQAIKISDTHYRIAEGNVFMDLLIGAEKAMLIDTGFGHGNLKKVVRDITDRPLIIVNTHGHPDHACANWQFEEQTWINEKDLKPCTYYNSPEFRADNMPLEKADDFMEEAYLRGGVGNLAYTKEGQIFDLGGLLLEVVDLPGHTAGSIGLMDRVGRRMFVGDAMNSALFLFEEGVSEKLSTYKKTLQKAMDLPVDALWLGHINVPVKKETALPKFMRCAETMDFDNAFLCGDMLGTKDVRLHVLPEFRHLIDPKDIVGSVYGQQLFANPDYCSIFISKHTID